MGKMNEIFSKQVDLQKLAFDKKLPCHDAELVAYFCLGLFGEIGEVMQADKTWKPYNVGCCDIENVREEIADCWLFLINLTLAEGMSYKDVVNAIQKKQSIIFERIKREKDRDNGTSDNN